MFNPGLYFQTLDLTKTKVLLNLGLESFVIGDCQNWHPNLNPFFLLSLSCKLTNLYVKMWFQSISDYPHWKTFLHITQFPPQTNVMKCFNRGYFLILIILLINLILEISSIENHLDLYLSFLVQCSFFSVFVSSTYNNTYSNSMTVLQNNPSPFASCFQLEDFELHFSFCFLQRPQSSSKTCCKNNCKI